MLQCVVATDTPLVHVAVSTAPLSVVDVGYRAPTDRCVPVTVYPVVVTTPVHVTTTIAMVPYRVAVRVVPVHAVVTALFAATLAEVAVPDVAAVASVAAVTAASVAVAALAAEVAVEAAVVADDKRVHYSKIK
jgi:hypothetical protein